LAVTVTIACLESPHPNWDADAGNVPIHIEHGSGISGEGVVRIPAMVRSGGIAALPVWCVVVCWPQNQW